MPKTRASKWSVGLGIAFVMLLALELLVAATIGGILLTSVVIL